MKSLIKIVFVTLMAFSSSVFASPLSDAKAAGLIGEQHTGYLGVVKSGAEALVKDINAKRKAAYKKVAAKRKTSLNSVELVAGQSAIEKTEKGHFIKRKGEGWKKK